MRCYAAGGLVHCAVMFEVRSLLRGEEMLVGKGGRHLGLGDWRDADLGCRSS